MIAPSETDVISGDTETGIPTVILQAQATGMPVISTKHADIPESVIHNKSGLLVEESDVKGLSESIIDLIKRDNLWGEMGFYGRKLVLKRHDINIVNKRLEYLYDRAIKMNNMV